MVEWTLLVKQMLLMLQEVVKSRKEKLSRMRLKEAMNDY